MTDLVYQLTQYVIQWETKQNRVQSKIESLLLFSEILIETPVHMGKDEQGKDEQGKELERNHSSI